MSELRRNFFRVSAFFVLLGAAVAANAGPPIFTKAFSPDPFAEVCSRIGLGSTSTLTFTIDNTLEVAGADTMSFTDILPAGMTLAAPAIVSNSCGGTLTAVEGGTTISLTDGSVEAADSCTIAVNVTSAVSAIYDNVSFDLTSSAGNSGVADACLVVDDELPGFSKSFDDSTVPFGGRSTLTFVIDNTTICGECESDDVVDLGFTDNLPAGMLVANPANASTNCGDPLIPPTLTADSGSSFITLDANGTASFPALGAEAICTVIVDVIGGAVGELGNVSDDLLINISNNPGTFVGKAAAVLEVTGGDVLLQLTKDFTNDPVPPGGIVDLEFTIENKSRDDSATGITFSDDLEATLTGLAPAAGASLPRTECGGTLDFALGLLTLTGGTVSPESSCSFTIGLDVPATTDPGTYPNTAGPVSGLVGGEPETGNVASDLLFVVAFPVLTKEFTDDPVGAGGTATLEFTITNTSASAMTDIEFMDDLESALPGLAANSLVTGMTDDPMLDVCGIGSKLTVFNPPDIMIGMIIIETPPDPTLLEFTGGSLAEAGMPLDSCTFSVTVDVPAGVSGIFTNTSGDISATVDSTTYVGPPASGNLEVIGSPRLVKQFIDDPVAPGGTVTLQFTLSHDESAPGDATGIAFSDDLTALLPADIGLTATSVVNNTCVGAVIDIGTPSLIDFMAGALAPGEECSFDVTLSVPGAATPGLKTNETSEVTATASGVAVEGLAAEDTFLVSGFRITKEFTDDPVIRGGTATLEFTLDNTLGTVDATAIAFVDRLDDVIDGMIAVAPPPSPCGGTLLNFGSLIFTGGSVLAGSSCSFSVTVTVPATIPNPGGGTIPTPDGTYFNTTEDESAVLGGTLIAPDPAIDGLEVNSTLIAFAKEFIDDPVVPGDTVTLAFTIENLSATETVTDIMFEDDLTSTGLTGLIVDMVGIEDCGGTPAGAGTGVFSYTGGSLAASASCSITVDLMVPVPDSAPPFINTTSVIEGDVGGLDVEGAAASDELIFLPVLFSKEFTDDPVGPGDDVNLNFMIENISSDALSGLDFSDNLDDVLPGLEATGLPPNPVCDTGTLAFDDVTGFLTLIGASVDPMDTCSFDVTLTVPDGGFACGSLTNSTSPLTQVGIPLADPATALLEVVTATTGPFIQDSGLVSIEAENFFTNEAGVNVGPWGLLEMLDPMDVSNAAAIKAPPPPGGVTAPGAGAAVTYEALLDSEPQYVWFRLRTFSSASDSFYFQLDDGPIQTRHLGSPHGVWRWVKLPSPVAVGMAGVHTLTIYRREGFLEVDKLVLTTDPGFDPADEDLGPPESARAGGCDNTAPVLDSIGELTAFEDTPAVFGISAADVDTGDTLAITAAGLPPFATLLDNGDGTAELTVTAGLGDAGDYFITITVTDDGSPPLSDDETFKLVVSEPPSTGPFVQLDGIASIEAEHFFTNDAGSSSGPWGLLDGLVPTVVSNAESIKAPGPAGGIAAAGLGAAVTYEVLLEGESQDAWVRVRTFSSGSDSFYFMFDGFPIQTRHVGNTGGAWKWVKMPGSFAVSAPGVYTLTVYRREGLLEADKLVMSTTSSGFVPTGLGPGESPRL